MAASAYAGVVSVMNILEQVSDHPRLSTSFDKNQTESLGHQLNFLLAFMESDRGGSGETNKLERRIASAAHAAEDVIESRIVDQIHAGYPEQGRGFSVGLQKIIEDMRLINEAAAEVERESSYQVKQPAAPTKRLIPGQTSTVGPDDLLPQLLNVLTGGTSYQEVISIVGTAGTGKTTLAKTCYKNTLIMEHFDVRAWACVSQDYSKKRVLLELVSCIRGSADELVDLNYEELGELLHTSLSGSRYLIVLDDVWSIESWDMIKFFFPDNNISSRIIVTTRLSNLASYLGVVFDISFSEEGLGWKFFCKVVFGDDDCPPELEEIGKIIFRECTGLPIALSVVGGLLKRSPMTREYWEYVAENLGLVQDSEEDKQVPRVLMWCYNALPTYLKPCFLYLGIFPEEHEFRVSQVVKLWVAEGFLKSRMGETLEDIGEGYIMDLIDRNLILVSSEGSNWKSINFRIHDLLRDLCTRVVADEEKYLFFSGKGRAPGGINSERRFIVHDSNADKDKDPQFFQAMESSLLARSVILHESPTLLSCKSRLLRVLVEVYSDSLETTLQQVNLRFLAYESIRAPVDWIPTFKLLPSISLLWNVQTLKIGKKIEQVVAPSEIWEMPQLRHLCFNRIRLPEPLASIDKDVLILQKLQTLKTVLDFTCSGEICKRMPNIKRMRISYDDFSGEGEKKSWFNIDHVGHFHKLESLSYSFRKVPNRNDLVKNLKFPHSLRKLILQDCELHWDDLSIIGCLPNLQVLKLKCQSVRGPKWNTVEGGFCSLRMLEIDSCYLINWDSEYTHFPCLQELVLRRLYRLKEIPCEIGYISTLEYIHVVDCNISAALSAIRILRDLEDFIDESTSEVQVQVRVRFRKEEELVDFTAKVEHEGGCPRYLHIDKV